MNAYAQGTRGELPDPITAARLDVYADMLELSPQQRHAINDLHAQYREEFQKLREGEIETWLQAYGQGFLPRSYYTRRRDLINRISAMDGRLFDSIAEIMTDEQNQRLYRVRQWRERDRAVVQPARGDAPSFDLLAAIVECGATSADWRSLEPVLESYHGEATSQMRNIVDEAHASSMRVHDALSKAGVTEAMLTREDAIKTIVEVSQPIYAAHAREQNARTEDLLALNRRIIDSVSRSMPGDFADRLQGAFLAVYGLDQLAPGKSPFAAALRRDDITDDQRAALNAESERFETAMADEARQMMKAIDAHRRRTAAATDEESRRNAEQETKALAEVGRESNLRVVTRYKEARARVSEIVGLEFVIDASALDPETADLSQVSVHSIIFDRPQISAWLPAAIGARDLAQYRRWLDLDAEDQERLTALHAEYLKQFTAFKDAEGEALMSARKSLYAGDSVEGFTDENLRASRAALAAATSRQNAIENAFFDRLAETLHLAAHDSGMNRVRLARQRQWFNCRAITGSQTRQPGGRSDGVIDLEMLLRSVRSFDASHPEIDSILAEYEIAVTPMLQSRLEAVRAYERTSVEVRVEWARRRLASGSDNPDLSDFKAARKEHELRVAATKAAEPIAELNAATVEKLAAAMPDAAERLRRTYERMAWPRIHDDRSSAGPLLTGALKISDLTSEQRTTIENIAAEYRPAYQAMCESMKSTVEGPDSPIYGDGQRPEAEWIDFQNRHRQRQRMLFDRHELNMRVRQSLKAVLTEEQAAALGLNAPPPEGPGEHDDFGS